MTDNTPPSDPTSTIPGLGVTTVALPKLLTIQEVAEYHGVLVRMVERWNYVGSGPKPIKGGRHVRCTVEAVRAHLDKLVEQSDG